MRLTTAILACLALALLLSPGVNAQPVGGDGDSPLTRIKRQRMLRDGKTFFVWVGYEQKKALAGSKNFDLYVWSPPEAEHNLKLATCEQCKKDGSPLFDEISGPEVMGLDDIDGDGKPEMKYHFHFAVKAGLQPREYQLTLRFEQSAGREDPNYEEPLIGFPLYVGVKEGGLLKVETGQSEEGREEGPEQATGGGEKLFMLELKNEYPDYDINIQQVTVYSKVNGLVARIVKSEPEGQGGGQSPSINFGDAPLNMEPGQRKELKVWVKLGGLGDAGSYITGFPANTDVRFRFDYDDGRGRKLSDFVHVVPLHMNPSRIALVVAVLIGVGVAVFLMSVWKVLKYEGSGRQRLTLVFSTVVIGLIVTILASHGQLNVSLDALQVRASHDMPLSLFLLSLVATVSGTPLLKKFFGVDKSADGGGGGAAAAPPATSHTGGGH